MKKSSKSVLVVGKNEKSIPIEERVKSTEETKLPTYKGKILTARPSNMSFENYKQHLREQKQYIKNRKKGFLVYLSVMIVDSPVIDKDYNETKRIKHYRTFPPFHGIVKNLKPI